MTCWNSSQSISPESVCILFCYRPYSRLVVIKTSSGRHIDGFKFTFVNGETRTYGNFEGGEDENTFTVRFLIGIPNFSSLTVISLSIL